MVEIVVSLYFGFPAVWGGPGGFRKVREAKRNNFSKFSSKTHVMVPSYDKKIKKFTTVEFTIIKV